MTSNQLRQDDIEKLRRDFENPVRRELTRPPGPDLVKRQDHATAAGEEAKAAISARCG
jgi:hypothetical protein